MDNHAHNTGAKQLEVVQTKHKQSDGPKVIGKATRLDRLCREARRDSREGLLAEDETKRWHSPRCGGRRSVRVARAKARIKLLGTTRWPIPRGDTTVGTINRGCALASLLVDRGRSDATRV